MTRRPPSGPGSPFVVLLRAVNVGGRTFRKPQLEQAIARAGGREMTLVGAAGSAVVAVGPRATPHTLEARLEQALRAETGLDADAMVRSAEEWDTLVRANPFPREAESDPAHLVVALLKARPAPAGWTRLARAIVGRERVAPGERAAYIVYPDGIGRSKLTPGLPERQLGVRGTSRNWNTVLRLQEIVRERSAPAAPRD